MTRGFEFSDRPDVRTRLLLHRGATLCDFEIGRSSRGFRSARRSRGVSPRDPVAILKIVFLGALLNPSDVAERVHDPGPVRPAALPRPDARPGDAVPERDPAIQGEAGAGGRFSEALRGSWGSASRQRPRYLRRADRGRDDRLRPAPEDDGRGVGQSEEGESASKIRSLRPEKTRRKDADAPHHETREDAEERRRREIRRRGEAFAR